MRKVSLHNMSARHKFKDNDTIEVVIMDQTDQEQFSFWVKFREMKVVKDEIPVTTVLEHQITSGDADSIDETLVEGETSND